jgi:hypothetical protein
VDDATVRNARPPRWRSWLLIPCAPVAITCALIPFTSLRNRGAPLWLATAAALAAFPVLPLLWHALAERKRAVEPGGPATAGITRFALRCLALALLVLAVSLSSLGPGPVGEGLARLVRPSGRSGALPAADPLRPGAAGRPEARHELESFIPADATLVLALSDAAALQPLLASSGLDANKKLAALQKCQIHTDAARILIVARGSGTRMIVVRAPGITDPRNLYCLVGFLGIDHLKLRFTSENAPVRFEVEGLFPGTLKFESVDERTVVTADGAWGDSQKKKLFAEPGSRAQGPLGTVLERVDRGARLWSAGLVQTDKGSWDLALHAKLEGTQVELHASSIPPSGASDEARLELRVPLAFAAALPAAALTDGLRGVVAALAAATAAGPP